MILNFLMVRKNQTIKKLRIIKLLVSPQACAFNTNLNQLPYPSFCLSAPELRSIWLSGIGK